MPIAKSPSMTFGESLRTPSRKQKANTSNTSSSTHDHESPMTSSYQQKSSWLHTVRKKFTFNKSPSPSSKRYSRKPIPEFSPADPQESCSTNVHYEHSESRERLEALATTKSHCNTCRSEHSAQKLSRRKSMSDWFGSLRPRHNMTKYDTYERDIVNTAQDLAQTPPTKPDVRIDDESVDNVNYGSEGFTYYSSVKKAPSLIVHCPASEPDAFEESQLWKEDREVKTPDSYLELLIRATESPYVGSNDYDDLFATPCRSNSRHVHYADLAHSTTAAKESSVDQKNTNKVSIDVGKASLSAAFGDFGLEFRQRSEEREERYHKLTTQSDVPKIFTPVIQKRFQDCREPDAETGWGHINQEMIHGDIEKMVATMTKNRHSSFLTAPDQDSSDAVEDFLRPFDCLSSEKNSTELKEVITRGKVIKEEVTKEEQTAMKKLKSTEDIERQVTILSQRRYCPHLDKFFDGATDRSTSPEKERSDRGEKPAIVKKLKTMPSMGDIERRDKFILRILEDSIELRTPLETLPYLPTKSLPYRTKSAIDAGKFKTRRAQKKTRWFRRTRQVSTTFVEFPAAEDEPMQRRRYNSQSDAMVALFGSCQNCEYSDYFIWDPKFRVYKALPHNSPIPDVKEIKRHGYELVRLPMHGEICNRASMLGGVEPFRADGKILASYDGLPSSVMSKTESLSLKPYESSYDAETAFLKIPLQHPEKQSSSLNLTANSKIAEEIKEIESKVPEDYFFMYDVHSSNGESFAGSDFAEEDESDVLEDFLFEHEIDSGVGRSFLRSDYSASSRVMNNPERLRIYRELMGSDIYDPSSPKEVPPSKTWFDLAREYKARHPVEEDVENPEDIPATSESYSDDSCYEEDFVEVCSEVSSTTCEKIMEELGLKESTPIATEVSQSSSTCSRPTFRHIEDIAAEEKQPVVVVTEIIPSEGESSRGGTTPVVPSLEEVDDAYPPPMIQELILSSMRKHMRKIHPERVDLQDMKVDTLEDDCSSLNDTDQSAFSITEYSPGFKFSKFEGVLKSTGESLTPTVEPRETKSLRPRVPHIELGSLPRNKAVTSFGSTKGKLPLRPEYTPIFDDIEPFDKPNSSKTTSTAITPDDLNIKIIGKAARQTQPAKPEGLKVGALVDVFQAHGLMSKRLRPELIKVTSPTNSQQQPIGRPPTPMPGTPSKAKFRARETDYGASNRPQSSPRAGKGAAGPTSRFECYSNQSDAETETSSVFGFDLDRVEARLQHHGEERAYRDSELYG